MVCDCCLKRKRLFESFAAVETAEGTINLCVVCNDLAYKIRDDANERNLEKFETHLKELDKRGKKAKPIFLNWKKQFVRDLESVLKSEADLASEEGKAAEPEMGEKPAD